MIRHLGGHIAPRLALANGVAIDAQHVVARETDSQRQVFGGLGIVNGLIFG